MIKITMSKAKEILKDVETNNIQKLDGALMYASFKMRGWTFTIRRIGADMYTLTKTRVRTSYINPRVLESRRLREEYFGKGVAV